MDLRQWRQMENMEGPRVDEVISGRGVAEAIRIKHVASLLFTYRCTIACRHCLFRCSPDQPAVRVSFEDGVEFLRQLRATDRVVHIAGGEPTIYYQEMLRIWRAADREGVSPHFFETNASWCVGDGVTRRRFRELREAGAKGVLISCDPYHLGSVPPSRFQRARRIALEVFGDRNVIAAAPSVAELRRMMEIGRSEELLGEYTRHHTPRLVGRAGEELARFLRDRRVEDLKHDALWHGGASEDESCRREFDPKQMWEIHIDPYANVQTCCAIIVGNAREIPLPELMKKGFGGNEIARAVAVEGPFGLLRMAMERGYIPRKGYPQKCNLCWEVRKFLRPYYPDILGPGEIYSGPAPG